jgi:anionic cell wall polymer biosynthesis LytR-Cps2A-Psr (LCP) family protein
MGRQRNVISALFKKMTASNPATLTETVKVLMPCITTNLTDGEIMEMILNLGSYKSYKLDQLMLPLETYKAMRIIRGMEMYDINWAENIKALHAFMES